MSIRILCSADLHLGKRSADVPQDHPEISTRHTWDRMVELAIQEKVDFFILTGDIIDEDNRYYESLVPMGQGLSRLLDAGIEVLMVSGNHDYDVLRQLVRDSASEHVHLLGQDGQWEPLRIERNGQIVDFLGWSFPSRHVRAGEMASPAYLETSPDKLSIGLLHGDVGVENSIYNPIQMEQLLASGVDLWVLGHIHKPDTLHAKNPLVFYPGSPHALSAKESGIHGPVLLDIDASRNIQMRRLPLSPVRYESWAVDVSGVESEEAFRRRLIERISEQVDHLEAELEPLTFLVLTITLKGSHARMTDLLSWAGGLTEVEAIQQRGSTMIRIRKVVSRMQSMVEDLDALARESTPAGILAHSILALQNQESTPFVDALLDDMDKKLENLSFARVYRPLTQAGMILSLGEEEKRDLLMNECVKLLNELVREKNE